MTSLLMLTLTLVLPAADAADDAPRVDIYMVAAAASDEGRAKPDVDAEIRPYWDKLKDLEFDTYRLVAKERRVEPYGTTCRMRISEDYTLVVRPRGIDGKGRIEIVGYVEEKSVQEGRTVTRKALRVEGKVAQGAPLRLGGLQIEDKRLVLLLTLRHLPAEEG
jgi:hypothetical protein